MRDLLRRRLGTVILVLVVLVVISATRVANLLTDLWWFDEVGAREVFTGVWSARLILAAVGGGGLALLVAVNLHVARRLRPLIIPATPQQAVVERYRQLADPYLPWLIGGIAVLFGLTAAGAAAADWEPFVLWRNGQEFGVTDPQFGRDVGFYVFQLPLLKALQSWLFTSLILVGFLTAGAHYLLGGIRPESPVERVLPAVRVHLSVLLAAILAARGWGYWLDRYLLNFSPRGQVTGASYTDVNAELPALYLLMFATAVAIVLVLANLRRRGFLLPGVAIGLLVLGSILLQGAYPAAIQRLRVEPQELEREGEYIGRNLEMTRRAFGLGDAEVATFTPEGTLTPELLRDEQITFDNVRLWDPSILETTYNELQALRTYYQFLDVDVDRYEIDGELRQVMLSGRELDTSLLDAAAQSWQNLTFRYTHGFGIVASQVNTATSQGQPVFLARDIPPRGRSELAPERAGIYYGESVQPEYSVVRGATLELDYEAAADREAVPTTYDGEGGVRIGSPLRRLAFALRFGETNFVLSDLVRPDSRILYRRQVRERVQAVAPYLSLDEDVYPVILDGRVVWVQDAYTTSIWYPYSQRRELRHGPRGSQQVNYVRNSVKAVVDAYDGDVTLYVVDDEDPVLRAWRQAFPSRYVDVAEAPEGLVEHWRYPEDLFTLQAELFQTYHIRDIAGFYEKGDEYQIPNDPAAAINDATASSKKLQPYYLLMRLPGEQEEEFVLIQPYLPREKANMVAWLAGRSDGDRLGELFSVQFPTDADVLGPGQVQTRIEQDRNISAYITLRDEAGSQVIRGNLLVLPVADTLVYVEPLFLAGGTNKIPELDKVAVVLGDQVAFEDTLERALRVLVGEAKPSDPTTGVAPPEEDGEEDPTATDDPDELLRQAVAALIQADAARQRGDLGRYQELVSRARELVERAAAARGVPAPQPTPSPGSTGSPTPAG